jgi:peptidoglycan/xylan/chitin deacetylase (PgdA/CDA1 family)
MMPRHTSLLYHDVVDGDPSASGFSGAAADRYKLRTSQFARHLDAVSAVAGPAVSVLATPPGDAFHMTFDDGGASSLAIADALEARGWVGHFFMPTAYVGVPGFLDAAGLRDLARRGHVVGSHSHSHPLAMSALGRSAMADEWHRSTVILSDLLGEAVSVGAIPAGSYSRAVAEAASEAGLDRLFTSEPTARPWRLGALTLYGRFSVVAATPPDLAAAYARGDARAVALQAASWKTKRAIRSAVGPLWGLTRDLILQRRNAG